MSPYKQWRRRAAKHFKCSVAGIDLAVKEGIADFHKAYQAGNPMAKLMCRGWQPMYVTGMQWYIYSQNPLLKLLMSSAPAASGASPFSRPVEPS